MKCMLLCTLANRLFSPFTFILPLSYIALVAFATAFSLPTQGEPIVSFTGYVHLPLITVFFFILFQGANIWFSFFSLPQIIMSKCHQSYPLRTVAFLIERACIPTVKLYVKSPCTSFKTYAVLV